MTIDSSKVDAILEFALLVAGEADDWRERQLGPIHLLKYTYLADLAYARKHEGQSFTGVPWQFFHFGPWSPAVLDRIEPALTGIGANRVALPSDYGDNGEWVRWWLRRDDLVYDLEHALPPAIVLAVRTYVRRFGSDTPNLLDFVYRTDPMRYAAPMEFLDLSRACKAVQPLPMRLEKKDPGLAAAKKTKSIRERFIAIRSEATDKARQSPVLVNPAPDARFDDVYFSGLEWMDKLAGEQLPEGDSSLEFGLDVWKSPTRTEHDPS